MNQYPNRNQRETQRQYVNAPQRSADIDEQKRRYAAKQRAMKERERKRKKARTRTLLKRILLFAVMFAIIAAVVAVCIVASFRHTNAKNADRSYVYTYSLGDDTSSKYKETVKNSKAVVGGERYFNFSVMASMMSMSSVGNSDEIRFVIPDSGDEAVIRIGSSSVSVNMTEWRMRGEAFRDAGGNIWMPISFIEEYMTGIDVNIDEESERVNIDITDSAGFRMKQSDTIGGVSDNESYTDTIDTKATDTDMESTDTDVIHTPDDTPIPEFKTDLSAYEKYMNPEGEERDAYLVLVNAKNPLDGSYKPDDLVEVVNTRKDGRNTQTMRKCAEKALEAMFLELYANGYDKKGPGGYPVSVMSGYRSYSYQKQLFDSYTDREMKDDPSLSREEAERITETYSARPGTSEHQTGLCIDMHNLSSAQKAFADEDAYDWLVQNCWKFGFILRFPKDKTDITGITYEPWHYRFVGRYHAYKIHESGMCLEEYVKSLG